MVTMGEGPGSVSGEAEEEKGKKKKKVHSSVPHCLEEIACLGPASGVQLRAWVSNTTV